MNHIKTDYTDAAGFQRRVLIPDDGSDPAEGIPLSFDFEALYAHMPISFVLALSRACWARGLIEPCDFMKSGADKLFRSAMLSVIKHDFLNVQTTAQENCDHGGT